MSSALLLFFEPELRAWFGVAPLRRVFWGYGVFASSVLAGIYALAIIEHRLVLQQALLVFFAGYTVWVLVSVWRCSENAEAHWRLIARSLTITWATNATMVGIFLQLDLIASCLKS